jgi:hypothetical protein
MVCELHYRHSGIEFGVFIAPDAADLLLVWGFVRPKPNQFRQVGSLIRVYWSQLSLVANP